ncbi:hypothetical protein K4K58_011697 [Colletotrichum sp. SAR11_239]|nr:hypothetical protein K4K58_011697 [Colletotrichum sp. SAR11_239]
MADELPDLPWADLAARFTFTHANPKASDYKDLFPRLEPEPTLVPGINDFIRVFTEAIAEYSARERSKYAAEYTSPPHDEILVDDEMRMISKATGGDAYSQLPYLSHLHFLGLPERPAGLAPYTRIPQRDVFHVEYMPHDSDILPVEEMLKKRGLPTELVAEVMDLADYKPRRRLKVAHDPFHRDNREELDKYLAECWAVMVRGDVFAKAFDCEMDWGSDLVKAFKQLFPGFRSIRVPETVRSDDAYVPVIDRLVCRSNFE